MGDVMHPLARTILQRLGLGLMTLFIVSIVIFSMVSWLPGDFAKAILGQAATEETVAAFQKEIGLDKPPVQRYVEWVGNVVQGEFGSSFASRVGYKRTVAELIAPCQHPVPGELDRRHCGTLGIGARHSRRPLS